jgi:hypothetical protein
MRAMSESFPEVGTVLNYVRFAPMKRKDVAECELQV